MNLAVIVATKDRPTDLRTMLSSVAAQTRRPDQVVVVDASAESVESVAHEFPGLAIRYLRHWPPSAAAQRNTGLAAVDPRCDLVGFMDDDIVLEPDAIEKMLQFWQTAGDRVGGAGFNWTNVGSGDSVPRSLRRLTSWLGLYPADSWQVARSGWQSFEGSVSSTKQAQWLPSGASVWRRELFKCHRFDPKFEGYSYLEDLDFSLSVAKEYELYVVAPARFAHYPAIAGRVSRRRFGRVEVANRLYTVRKNGLSTARCFICLLGRMAVSACRGVRNQGEWERLLGNVEQLLFRSIRYR
jgi:glycosyltransferase involved in cell wall biosynthesis